LGNGVGVTDSVKSLGRESGGLEGCDQIESGDIDLQIVKISRFEASFLRSQAAHDVGGVSSHRSPDFTPFE
jgi:hypothetical protein